MGYKPNFLTGGTPSADGGTPANAFDGDWSTEWEIGGGYPHYLQYDLGVGNAKAAVKLTLISGTWAPGESPKAFTLLGSNTGVFGGEETTLLTVTDAGFTTSDQQIDFTFANTTAFRYYRLNATSSETGGNYAELAEMMAFEDDGYGSDVCTGGTASAKSNLSGHEPAKAFDDLLGTSYESDYDTSWWLEYDLGTGITKVAAELTLTSFDQYSNEFPKNFTLKASNTGVFGGEETTLLTVTNAAATQSHQQFNWPFSNSTGYRYYRLVITAVQSGDYAQVAGMTLHESGGSTSSSSSSTSSSSSSSSSQSFSSSSSSFSSSSTSFSSSSSSSSSLSSSSSSSSSSSLSSSSSSSSSSNQANNFGNFANDLPRLELYALGAIGNAGIFDESTQHFEIESEGIAGGVGTVDVTLPYFTLLAEVSAGSVDLTLPYFVLEAIGDGGIGVDYVAVMNILNFAISEYQNFNFNSYCAMGELYLGADQHGIHKLYGDDDNGEEIDLEIEKTGMDFKSVHEKRPTDIYLGLYSQGDFQIEVITESMSQLYLENCSPSGSIRTFKIKPGKGLTGRYLGFNIKNLKGADLALTQVAMLVEILSRRARG